MTYRNVFLLSFAIAWKLCGSTPGCPEVTKTNGNSTGIELCPVPDFISALYRVLPLLKEGTLERAGGEGAVVHNFRSKWSTKPCLGAPDLPRWGPSERPVTNRRLIINIGDGTTGTRFINCAVKRLKLLAAHGLREMLPQLGCDLACIPTDKRVQRPIKQLVDNPGFGTNATCGSWTKLVDAYDYISDSPVPHWTAALMATHQGGTAAVLLSLRDPWEWTASRLTHHARDAPQWTVAHGGCASGSTHLEDDDGTAVALDVLTYDAWAACLALRGRDPRQVLLMNLFQEDPGHVRRRFMDFLSAAGWGHVADEKAVGRAWDRCSKN